MGLSPSRVQAVVGLRVYVILWDLPNSIWRTERRLRRARIDVWFRFPALRRAKTRSLARIRRLMRATDLVLAGIRSFVRATTLEEGAKLRFVRSGIDHWASPIALRESVSL